MTTPRRTRSLDVIARLTPNDRAVISYLVEHRVLTTHQITDLLYTTRTGPSTRWAQHRLATLRQLGVLDRFRPRTDTGSAPYHWILDTLGAEIAGYQLDLAKGQTAALVHAGRAAAHSPTLAHT
ncbi:MAG: replication-relaxation family protein, partial [Sporichthyaceae bacterium]|nr:replication-relaxation family protein [Sporichthyaceae bacterium]